MLNKRFTAIYNVYCQLGNLKNCKQQQLHMNQFKILTPASERRASLEFIAPIILFGVNPILNLGV